MIKLHATKKLLAKLPVNKQGMLPNNKAYSPSACVLMTNPLSGWHANLITLQRRQCILMVHDATRFPLLIIGLTKPDFARLNWYFEDALMNTLLKLGANQQQLDAAVSMLGELCIDSVCDRSVQGTMNQMKQNIEHLMWFDNVDIADLSAYRTALWLADTPCTVKGEKDCIWPHKAMLALLDRVDNTPDVGADNVVHLKDYQTD